jgi:predicted esterase
MRGSPSLIALALCASAACIDADINTGGSGGGGTPPIPPGPITEPVIPPITGECPTFVNGVATIGGLGNITLMVGDKKPSGGSLLFYWHGTGSNGFETYSMLPAKVRDDILGSGGIIVVPQNSLGTGGDCSGTATFSKDDFRVADLIAACAVRDHNIDPRRIYTTGCSAGGLQAGCMASLRSSYIAAAVPNSGGIVFPQQLQTSGHVPALMTMHGGAADWVAVSFSETSATLNKQFSQAGGFVVNCNHGGGHCGAPAELYSAGWDFMKAHPFGVTPEPYGAGLPSNFPNYCKIY